MDEIIKNIHKKAKKINRPLRLMELCGTHSETIAKHSIKSVLPKNIFLVSGPGCPVCVTDQEDIDTVVGLALEGIPVAAYGDAAGVPGNLGSLEEARQKGAGVYVVYDVLQALEIKKTEPNLVFWGLGFETTTPATAWAMEQGLTAFSSHKVFPPAMEMLLKNRKITIDGFINPGHVSAIIGTRVYKKFKIPQVVAGFSAQDVLLAVEALLDQILTGEWEVRNEYARLVKQDGNKKAQEIIGEFFEIKNVKWRGLGMIEKSGLKIRKKYQKLDAEFLYADLIKKIKSQVRPKASGCRCGEVLQGIIGPRECPLFGKACHPENPQGACMVSQEGACNIEYRFNKQ